VRRRPVFFLHIPKTAGTSFLLTLENHFGSRRLLRLDTSAPDIATRLHDALTSGRDSYHCLAGHLPLHALGRHRHEFRVLTFLRHPFARIFSLYRFLQRAPAATKANLNLAEGFSFTDFITSDAVGLYEQTHNGMCRLLCGDPAVMDSRDPGFSDPDGEEPMLARAMAALDDIDFGLVEQMPASLGLLAHMLGQQDALEEHVKNTTGQDGTEADPAALLAVARRNTADLALYEHAATLFRTRVRADANVGDKTGAGFIRPTPGEPVAIADMAGRQGFHEAEKSGFAWLKPDRPARLYIAPPTSQGRLALRLYCVIPNYTADRLVVRLNGTVIPCQTAVDETGWCTLHTEPLTFAAGVNELSLDPSHFISVRLLDPNTQDERYLSVALESLTLLA